jgi:hydrogenase expression/formation protein HypE
MDLNCPLPLHDYPYVLLAHGGGGRLMQQLIDRLFRAAFTSVANHDAAVLPLGGDRLAFTTDSYVVNPLFFPGGDIGELAVNGTVNDLAMAGARPLYLSVGFILEEGLPMDTLWRVVQSMARAAERAQVTIVTGDTKVVDRGKGDGIYINTAGIGRVETREPIAPDRVRVGDVAIINGDLGRHGLAVMLARDALEFESPIESDTAPLAELVLALLEQGIEPHMLRDLTRGGLVASLHETATAARVTITIDEPVIPIREDVAGACEILGFDPLYVANEGRFVVFVPEAQADRTIDILRQFEAGSGAVAIGRVTAAGSVGVLARTALGIERPIDLLSGEQLPRIC